MNRRRFLKASLGSAVPLVVAPVFIPRLNAWSIEDISASRGIDAALTSMGPMGVVPENILRAVPNLRWVLDTFGPEGARSVSRTLGSIQRVFDLFGVTQAKAQLLGLKASVTGTQPGTLSCGAYYPDATTTGVPAGTTLSPSGNVTSGSSGQVITALNISGTVRIRHNNVTLQRCLITSSDPFIVECDANTPTGFVFQDCEINGVDTSTWGFNPDGGGGGSICRRNNFYASENAIGIGENSQQITDNYIHDLASGGTKHTDGIQGTGGYTALNIDHNSIYGVDTSCVIQQNEFAGFSGLVVNNNLLVMVDGAAALYIRGDKSSGVIGACSVTNNRMGAGNGGYSSIADVTGPLTWTGNVDYITCASVAEGS